MQAFKVSLHFIYTYIFSKQIFKANKKKSEINLIRDIIVLFSYIFNAI